MWSCRWSTAERADSSLIDGRGGNAGGNAASGAALPPVANRGDVIGRRRPFRRRTLPITPPGEGCSPRAESLAAISACKHALSVTPPLPRVPATIPPTFLPVSLTTRTSRHGRRWRDQRSASGGWGVSDPPRAARKRPRL